MLAPSCATCGTTLQRLRHDALCERCWTAIRPFTPPFCFRCGDPVSAVRQRLDRLRCEAVVEGDATLNGSSVDPSRRRLPHEPDEGHFRQSASENGAATPVQGEVCAHCTTGRSAIDRARAIGSHDGALRDVIHALKYGKHQSIAGRLGRLMRLHGADVLADADLVIPVPLHWSRRYWRGFNQAELLAAHLGLPVGHVLRRVRRTRPQVELPARERHANVERAFALRRRDAWLLPAWFRHRVGTNLAGLKVVLVDDVTTTGATLESCAGVLIRAGASEVRVLTAARVATKSY